MIKPLYAKLYSARYTPRLAPALIRNLHLRAAIPRSLTPSLDTLTRTCPDWVIYTDEAYVPSPVRARVAAIASRCEPGGPYARHDEWMMTGSPIMGELTSFHTASVVFGLELATVAMAIYSARTRLQGKAVAVYIDNNAYVATLINGDSSEIAAFRPIATLWYMEASFDIAILFGRVNASRNIADLPQRGRPPHPRFFIPHHIHTARRRLIFITKRSMISQYYAQ